MHGPKEDGKASQRIYETSSSETMTSVVLQLAPALGDPFSTGLQASGAMDSRIARLTGEAGLEKRMLLRRFRKATDLTTIDYC